MTADSADYSSMIAAPLRFRRRHVVCLVIDPKESKLWRASFKGHYPIYSGKGKVGIREKPGIFQTPPDSYEITESE
jgi:hypothetical protein